MRDSLQPPHGGMRFRCAGRFPTTALVPITALLALALWVALAAATTGSALAAPTCTISWSKAIGGNWSEAGNWSLGRAPTAADHVCITLGGNYQVAVDTPANAASLRLETTSGTATLAINNTLTVTGPITNSEKLNLGGQSVSAASLVNNAELNVWGSFSGDIVNAAGARMNVPVGTGFTFNQPGATLTNRGTLTVLANAYFNAQQSGQSFVQESGTVTLDGSLTVGAGFFTFNGGEIIGVPTLNGAQVTLGPGAGPAELVLYGNATLLGTVRSGQKIRLNGTITIPQGLSNGGTVALEGGRVTIETGALTTSSAGRFEITTSSSLSGSWLNQGTMRVRASVNLTLDRSTTYTNTGALTIDTGGQIYISAANPTFVQSGGTLLNGGTFYQYNGAFRFEGGTLTGNALELYSARLSIGPAAGAGSFNTHNESTLSGQIRVGQTVAVLNTLTIIGNLSNAGTLSAPANSGYYPRIMIESGTLTNSPAGTLDMRGVGGTTISGNVTNQGDILVGSQLMLNQAGATFFNSGRIELENNQILNVSGGTFVNQGGTLTGGSFQLGVGATLMGYGTLTSDVTNNGTLNPGQPLGTLTINGDYAQSGTLVIEIGGRAAGSELDKLIVTGQATLGGTLSIRLVNYFLPVLEDNFNVLSYGSRNGTSDFGQYSGLAPRGVHLTTTIGDTGLTIGVDSVEVVEGPTWLALLYLGGDDTLDTQGKLTGLSAEMRDLVARLNTMAYNPAVRIVVLYDGDQVGDSEIYTREPGGLVKVTEEAAASPLWSGVFMGGASSRELNTGSVDTLRSFVSWAKATYPGPRYTMLSIVNHGGGWAPDLDPPGQPRGTIRIQAGSWRGMSVDMHSAGSSFSTRGLGEALRGQGPFDVLFFDACLMGMLETAFEARDEADFLIAGENLLFAELPYDDYLARDGLTSDLDPIDLARRIVDRYNAESSSARSPYIVSALDLRQLRDEVPDNLATRVERLASQILLNLPEQVTPSTPLVSALVEAYVDSQKFDYDNDGQIGARDGYVDLVHFARLLAESNNAALAQSIRSAAASVAAAATDGPTPVIFRLKRAAGSFQGQSWNFANAFGLSIFLPLGEQDYRPSRADPQNAQVPAEAERQLAYYADGSQLALTYKHPRWSELLVRLEPAIPSIRTGPDGLPLDAAATAATIDTRPFQNPGQVPAARKVFLPMTRR